MRNASALTIMLIANDRSHKRCPDFAEAFGGYIDKYYFHIDNKHQKQGHGLLTASKDHTNQKFEFYSCGPPSGDFKQSTGKNGTDLHAYGVIRSAQNNDQCLTIVHDSKLVTEVDAVMTLIPCSKNANRRENQWFEIRGDVVDYVGKKGDTKLQSTYELNDGVVGIQASYTRGKGLNFGFMKLVG